MLNRQNVSSALHWANESSNPATRGRRLTAFLIAVNGPAVVDGCASIKDAAAARHVSESLMHFLLAELRVRYGLIPPCEIGAVFHRQNGKKIESRPLL